MGPTLGCGGHYTRLWRALKSWCGGHGNRGVAGMETLPECPGFSGLLQVVLQGCCAVLGVGVVVGNL